MSWGQNLRSLLHFYSDTQSNYWEFDWVRADWKQRVGFLHDPLHRCLLPFFPSTPLVKTSVRANQNFSHRALGSTVTAPSLLSSKRQQRGKTMAHLPLCTEQDWNCRESISVIAGMLLLFILPHTVLFGEMSLHSASYYGHILKSFFWRNDSLLCWIETKCTVLHCEDK